MESIQQSVTYLTVLSGFLGAGKTTLLNHILKNSDQQKLAVIVNDLGKVNLDAAEVENVVSGLPGAVSEVMELTNGCICCGVQSELWDALHEVIVDYKPEHILIEATGAADPKQLLENLFAYNLYRANPGQFVDVANAITVVSCDTLQQTFAELSQNNKKTKRLLSVDPRKPVSELQFSQIECADIIVLNKTDLVEENVEIDLEGKIKNLNHRAEIIKTRFADLPVHSLFTNRRFDKKKTLNASRWQQELISTRKLQFSSQPNQNLSLNNSKTKHTDYGIRSFVYQSRKRIDEAKLYQFLKNGIPGLLRAKGYYWTVQNPDSVGTLSICGEVQRLDYGSIWWKSQVQKGLVLEEYLPKKIKEIWDDHFGDCRQEIVFIGIDIDEVHIRNELNTMLENS